MIVAQFMKVSGVLIAITTITAFLIACGGDPTPTPKPAASAAAATSNSVSEIELSGTKLSGTIEIDGSSTVFPISQAVAEEFRKVEPGVQVNVGVSGTGGGFKRFTVGETDISDASRPIKEKEAAKAQENNVEYIEMRLGTDGLTVIVNKDNSFVDCLTITELNAIWKPGSTINNWKDVRPGFPDQKLRLYGPDTDSGTFDYFTEEVNGEAQVSRADYTASADDNVLVQGVSGDKGGLGYFGYAYYKPNAANLKALAIDNGKGCVDVKPETIEDGSYSPLSRPLFIYVNKASMARSEVKKFIEFYLDEGAKLTNEVGYVAADQDVYDSNKAAAGL
jgi:phosphate transport system substrate-binding protein